MRHGAARRGAIEVQRKVLSRGHALHPFRSGDRVYVSVGGRLQRGDCAEQPRLLEHAQLHLDLDGRLRLRSQKRRAGLEKISATRPANRHCPEPRDSHLHVPLEPPNTLASMIHHVVLYKLRPEVTPARVEEMMMNTR